jgi:hypothetical protein
VNSEIHYIVRVKLQAMRARDGSNVMPENEEAWLGEVDGTPTVCLHKSWAKKFTEPPTKEEIMQWDGKPWTCRIKSHEIIKVETIPAVVTETVVN